MPHKKIKNVDGHFSGMFSSSHSHAAIARLEWISMLFIRQKYGYPLVNIPKKLWFNGIFHGDYRGFINKNQGC
jgi:hypothetical protein